MAPPSPVSSVSTRLDAKCEHVPIASGHVRTSSEVTPRFIHGKSSRLGSAMPSHVRRRQPECIDESVRQQARPDVSSPTSGTPHPESLRLCQSPGCLPAPCNNDRARRARSAG
jgi:hypothetical protein